VGAVGSVALAGVGTRRDVVAVARDGRVLRLDAALDGVREVRRAEPGARVVAGPAVNAGYGVLAPRARSAAPGRFFGAGTGAVALVVDETVVVVDLATGGIVFRAEWPELRAVASGDLDADGLDELIVAGARRVSVLTRSAAGSRSPVPSDLAR
jgi:hypothetical protein